MKLNLGCGSDIRPDYLNVDIFPYDASVKIVDVEKPLPFEDNQFEEILAQDILEHVTDLCSVMKELARVLKPNGRLVIRVPHFTFRNVHIDPTHKRGCSYRTFEFFVKSDREQDKFFHWFSKTESFDIHFEDTPIFIMAINLPFNLIMTFSDKWKYRLYELYERTFLCRLFPAANLEVVLVK